MNDQSEHNPYESPETEMRVRRKVEFELFPCPKCKSTNIQPTPYSAWHGRRAPRASQDVTCLDCRCNFDGEIGIEYPPRKNPAVWFLLALLGFVLYLVTVVLVNVIFD